MCNRDYPRSERDGAEGLNRDREVSGDSLGELTPTFEIRAPVLG